MQSSGRRQIEPDRAGARPWMTGWFKGLQDENSVGRERRGKENSVGRELRGREQRGKRTDREENCGGRQQ